MTPQMKSIDITPGGLYGVCDDEAAMTRQQIADYLGVSSQRVQQIEASAIAKFKRECSRRGIVFADVRRDE